MTNLIYQLKYCPKQKISPNYQHLNSHFPRLFRNLDVRQAISKMSVIISAVLLFRKETSKQK